MTASMTPRDRAEQEATDICENAADYTLGNSELEEAIAKAILAAEHRTWNEAVEAAAKWLRDSERKNAGPLADDLEAALKRPEAP